MKKTKKIIITAVVCLLVLLSSLPVSALDMYYGDEYGYKVAFAGMVGNRVSTRTKLCEFRSGGEIRSVNGSEVITFTNCDVWLETNGDINFYNANTGQNILYYNYAEGYILIAGSVYQTMVFIYCNTVYRLNNALYMRIFIFDDDDLISQGVDIGYNQGYQEGFLAGQASAEEGDFKDGYDAAIEQYEKLGVKNLFSYLYMTITWFVGNDQHSVKTRPNVDGSTITFTTAYNDLVEYCNANSLSVPSSPNLAFYFVANQYENEVVMSFLLSDFVLVIENGLPSNSTVNDLYMTIRYTQSQAEYPDETYNPLEVSTIEGVTAFRGWPVPLNVYQFGIVVSSSYSLSELRFSTDLKISNEGYRSGYLAGFSAGFTANSEETAPLIRDAYDRGYNIGYSIGKSDGIAIADIDFFDLCFAVAQAPIDVLYGVFDFEILGFNMRGAIGSLATVCVVVLLVKFLLFFLS